MTVSVCLSRVQHEHLTGGGTREVLIRRQHQCGHPAGANNTLEICTKVPLPRRRASRWDARPAGRSDSWPGRGRGADAIGRAVAGHHSDVGDPTRQIRFPRQSAATRVLRSADRSSIDKEYGIARFCSTVNCSTSTARSVNRPKRSSVCSQDSRSAIAVVSGPKTLTSPCPARWRP